jgi:hypothetical protein
MNQKLLLKIKEKSVYGILIGIMLAVGSMISYCVADYHLIKLDEGKLDQPMVEE